MNARYIIAAGVLTVGVLIGLSLPLFAHEGHGKGEVAPYDLDTPRKVSPETAAHIGLLTAEVDFGAVEEILRLTGVVRAAPDRVQAITSRIAGTVGKVMVQVGDTVEKGDLVAELDSPALAEYVYEARKLDSEYFELLSEVARAQSKVDELQVRGAAATEHASIVQAEYTRLQSNNGAISVNLLSGKQADAVRTRSEAKLREIELVLARQQVDAIRRQADAMQRSREALGEVIALIRAEAGDGARGRVGLVRFHAPIDGVVIARNVNAGQGVEAGGTLLEIADYSQVQIEGELPESLVNGLGDTTNNAVRIRRNSDANGELIGVGRVRFISPVIDAIKRTTHLIVEADNPRGLLRDGLYVDLSIVLREETSAVVVPVSAVVIDGPMHFVFVKDGEFYKKQDINPGYRDDRVVEVLDGVLPGDVVVTRGAYSLTQLRPKAATATVAAPESSASEKSTG